MSPQTLKQLRALSPETLENEIYKAQLAEVIELSKNSLGAFTRLYWKLVEPATKYLHNWHLDAITEHLEACTKRQIKKLIINVPPRHLKSVQVAVMWPSWIWATQPHARFIFGSYSYNFALRDAVKMRHVIQHPSYKENNRLSWEIKDDQNQKGKFENTKGGFRFTTSVGGGLTGEGGDYLVVDDPTNAIDAHSKPALEEAILWWTQAMSTRGNDPDSTVKVVVMQRLHENDLTGHLLQEGGYEHLVLPAEFDPDKIRKPTSIGWKDPRKEKGELLHPERFSQESINELKKELGSLGSASQLQQDPKPASGGLIKRKWWQYYKAPPAQFEMVAQFWDCAEKPGITKDYSVCATWAKAQGGFYLIDLWRGKVEAPDLENLAVGLWGKERPHVVVIEDKSHGSALIQYLRRKHRHIPVKPFEPKGSKEVRATAATPTIEAGNCHLPFGTPWLEDFISEHENFPLGSHDDQVDTTTMMIDYFINREKPQPRIRSL